MTEPVVLHEYSRSGNCYKLRLTMAHLGIPYERREYDIMKGETRTPEFLSNVNSNGRIPVLQVGDRFLPESNAAMWYLAEGTRLVLTGSTLRARPAHFKAALAGELRREVWPHLESGAIRPVIDSVFPLERAADAHRRMESGEHVGKLVLTMGEG